MKKYDTAYLENLVRQHGGVAAASRATGIPERTFYRRMAQSKTKPEVKFSERVIPSPLPSRKIPLEERLTLKRKAYDQLTAHKSADAWRGNRQRDRPDSHWHGLHDLLCGCG